MNKIRHSRLGPPVIAAAPALIRYRLNPALIAEPKSTVSHGIEEPAGTARYLRRGTCRRIFSKHHILIFIKVVHFAQLLPNLA